MANIKISELEELVNVAEDDYFPIVDTNEGETKKLNFETITKTILNTAFPIGKVEVFFDNDDHSNYLGFEWERTAIGKTPVGIDESDTDFNVIGKIGGEKKHTLTVNEMPSHTHLYRASVGAGNSEGTLNFGSNGSVITGTYGNAIQNTGGSQPHNNLQPYEVMAFWKRVN